LQTQLDNLDLTYATIYPTVQSASASLENQLLGVQSQIVAASASLQTQLDNLDSIYATDASVVEMSSSFVVYLPQTVGYITLNTLDSAYTVTNSLITTTSIPHLTLVPPVSGNSIYALGATNITGGSFVIETSEIPSVAGYRVIYVVYGASVGVPPVFASWDSSNTFGGDAVFSNNDYTVAINAGATEHIIRTTISKSSGKWAVVMYTTNNFGNIIGGFQISSASQSGDFIPHGNTKRGFQANGSRWLFLVDLDSGMLTLYKDEVLNNGPNPLTDWFAGATYFAAAANLDRFASVPAVTIDTGAGFTSGELSIIAGYGAHPGWFN
jgi:hypothetical protein